MMQPVFTEASESLQGLIPRLLEEVALRQVERELTDVYVVHRMVGRRARMD
jgi:hypothetical protein